MSWVIPGKHRPPIGEHVLFVIDQAKFTDSFANRGTFTCVGFFDGREFMMIDAPSNLLVTLPLESILFWKHMDVPPSRWTQWLVVRWLRNIYRCLTYGAPVYILIAGLFIFNSYMLKQDLVKHDAVTSTMLRYTQQQQIISKTLQIAYRLNPDMADMCAVIYQSDARRYGIEWFWFGATTRIESNFNTVAISPSDAKGLSQLLEPTASGLCKKLGLRYVKNVTVWEAPTNLRLGDAYIAEGLKEGKAKNFRNPMEFAVKRFLGGSKFKTYPDQAVLDNYYKNTLSEYETLRYIYKGVSTDYNL